MSETAVTAQCGNPAMSRTFSHATATDGQYNNLVSSSSQQLGLELPMQTITEVQVAVAVGAVGTWKIMDSRSLQTRRQGLTYITQFGCMMEAQIVPYVIQPQDVLQVYTNPAAASNKNNSIGLVTTTAGQEPFGFLAGSDGEATAVTNLLTAQTVGDWAFGTTITGIEFQVDQGHTIQEVTVVDQTGGQVMLLYGSTRLPTAGAKSILYNIKARTALPIQKGWTLRLKAESND